MKEIVERLEDGRILLRLSKKIYEKEAVLAAAYKFTNRCHIYIEPGPEDTFEVYFKGNPDGSLEQIAGEYCNELVDQQLRLEIEKRCGNIRDLIVKQAFAPVENVEEKLKP